MTPQSLANESRQFDYIIVGSGAGGGPLAARLAQAGKRVLVLEAGSSQGLQPATDPAHEVSLVPSLHGVSTEHEDLSWRFFVKHYDRPPTGADPKHHEPDRPDGGIFYPRAAALGGCTIHNAMITIVGPDSDWDDLADFLADESWRASRMRAYFRRMEANGYSPKPTLPPRTRIGRGWENVLWLFGREPDHTSGRHGFNGWLHTSVTDISLGLNDKQLVKMLKAALRQANRAGLERSWTLVRHFLKGRIFQSLDPNHAQTQAESPEGLVLIPLAVCGRGTTVHQDRSMPFVMRGRRSSPREFLLQTQASHPENLTIWTDCLVTKVLLDGGNPPRAYGVEFKRGRQIYRAHVRPNAPPESTEQVVVREGGEVILCGGAFNTPQLLMLSGVGDTTHLAEHGIECRVHLPGVGLNLQDRYEVTVISQMKRDFSLLNRATFALPDPDADPHLREWREEGTGLYTSNGAVLGIFKRSTPELVQPDLFIFGIPLPFEGYKVGYSDVGDQHNLFTWAILKGQTRNHDGRVRLRSADPLDTPEINFHYFNEVSRPNEGGNDPDLLALLDGVKFVRGIADHAQWWIKTESHPGAASVPVDNDEGIKDWIRRVAWGHHACGTCRMGPDGDSNAVLDNRFRVRNVTGLRVVDASVFPRIPGYFIVANIYLASEKAADVILEDASNSPRNSPIYPRELREREADAIQKRRSKATLHSEQEATPAPPPVFVAETWSDDVTGLGLSGGGIRSATFNLGVLQALASAKCLARFDFLSTVSGGGYIGAFLGRFFDRLRAIPLGGAGSGPTLTGPQVVEQELTDSNSRVISWLRKHGNYIAPSGQGDVRVNSATFLRNLLSVHFVVGTLLLAAFGVANAIRYGLFDQVLSAYGLVVSKGHMPLGHLIETSLGPFFSPWFVLFELIVLFVVVPRIVGYWIVSQDQHERYQFPPLAVLFLVATVLLWLSVRAGLVLEPLLLGLSLLSSLVHVELTWRGVRLRERATGTGGVETQRLRSRNYLTYDLGLALALAGVALAFALVDTVGHGLQQWIVESNIVYAKAFAAIGAAIIALTPIARMAANLFAREKERGPSTIGRLFKEQMVAGLLAIVLLAIPLIGYSFAAHAGYQGGSALWTGLGATLLALVISIILVHPKALSFVNRSSLAQAYGARLARAYLGASNPLRHRADGANVTEVMASDDVASIRDYRPHESGGPLHLINVIVNQTVDFNSQRGNQDRKGENIAVSPIAMSIGKTWHSAWIDDSPAANSRAPRKRPCGMLPLGHLPGSEHPLIDEVGKPAKNAEMLSLRQWIAISGAAVGPGRGQSTQLGTALLFGLANLRTGHWWNSGIAEAARDGFPKLSFMRRILYLLPKAFITQSLLLFEWVAHFAGPWEQYWNISDGGFFENLGGYELIRRRVPRIIISDASADPLYQYEGLANLMRKSRIDFSADIVPFTAAELEEHVPIPVRQFVGTLEDLKPERDADGTIIAPSKAHAALFWVRYASNPEHRSVLLYLKALMTGDESADVRHYHATHPEFPHEGTADQFFDESQWESYRRVGEHVAAPLFADPTWFWAIPVR